MSSNPLVPLRWRRSAVHCAFACMLFLALISCTTSDVAANSAQEHPNPAAPAEAAPAPDAESEQPHATPSSERSPDVDQEQPPRDLETPASDSASTDTPAAEGLATEGDGAAEQAVQDTPAVQDHKAGTEDNHDAASRTETGDGTSETSATDATEAGDSPDVPQHEGETANTEEEARKPATEAEVREDEEDVVEPAPAAPAHEQKSQAEKSQQPAAVNEEAKPTREELVAQREQEAEEDEGSEETKEQERADAASSHPKSGASASSDAAAAKGQHSSSSTSSSSRSASRDPAASATKAAPASSPTDAAASSSSAPASSAAPASATASVGSPAASASGAASVGSGGGSAGGSGDGGERRDVGTAARKRAVDERAEKTLITELSASGGGSGKRGGGEKPAAKPETEAERRVRELVEDGERCLYGVNNTKVDLEKALTSLSKASALGSLRAKALMGEMYKHGWGVEVDTEAAVTLFRKAAEGGDPAGQRNLAFLYAAGIGIEEDRMRAVLHYHFAATGNDHLAQLALGYRHMYGVDVPKNCQAAVEYYLPAAEAVVREVQQFRPPPMMERHSLANDGSKPRPADQDEDVVDYYQYSAARGDASAQVALGQLHYFGARGLEQDYGEALRWYEKAGEQGDGNALGHMGNMYVQGIHVKASNETALRLFRQGVEKSNPVAINGLGYMHMYGMGVDQSYSEAMKLFSQAAEQGNQEARFNLGAMYITGLGVSKDYAKAIYYFTLAANRGHMLALYNLAMMHLNGFGTPRSCTNALQFIKSVAERGSWGLKLQQAYKLHRAGEVDPSLLLYTEAAELGYEVAQSNVAHIYDEGGSSMTADAKRKALAAYEISAQQGAVGADLKIGDLYYYGMGTEVNFRKAVTHYRAASEARNAQAMFNLAFMHEHGIGLPQDLHLAKRFYDMAAETSQDAVWPVALCRTKLLLVMAFNEAVEYIDQQSMALSTKYGPRYGIWLPPSTVWLPWLAEQWDLILIALLVCQLSVVLLLRNHLSAARLQPARR